jgi:signal transduction histidine kinase
MGARKSLLGLLHRRPLPVAGALAVCLAAVQVFVDWVTWIEFNEAIVYPLPLVLAAMARGRRLLWGLALFLVGTTFAVYAVQIGPGVFSLREPLFVNRVLAAVTVLLTAGLLHAWTLALDKLDEQDRSLTARNEQLDAANRELVRCQEEITRQNEELDRRRREAEESSGRKTRLLASASHDIRNGLYVLHLLTEVMRQSAERPSVAAGPADNLERLRANLVSLEDLVSDLVEMARLDSGRTDIKASTFSLNDLLAGQCRDLAPLAQTKALRLGAELPETPLWLCTDRGKLSRVLSNLIGNAIKFTQTGGVTVIAARSTDGDVLIRIHDTGVGIAPGQLELVFDEFTQVDNTGGGRDRGWGLGLAICRRLIGAMGGAVGVESTVGQGSVFTVRLPSRCLADTSDTMSEPCRCATPVEIGPNPGNM